MINKFNLKTVLKMIFPLKRSIKLTSFNFASKEFEGAKVRLSSLKEDPGNEAKLKIYALFKQVYKIYLMVIY